MYRYAEKTRYSHSQQCYSGSVALPGGWGGKVEGDWGMEVPQWGPKVDPRWGSVKKLPETKKHDINFALRIMLVSRECMFYSSYIIMFVIGFSEVATPHTCM